LIRGIVVLGIDDSRWLLLEFVLCSAGGSHLGGGALSLLGALSRDGGGFLAYVDEAVVAGRDLAGFLEACWDGLENGFDFFPPRPPRSPPSFPNPSKVLLRPMTFLDVVASLTLPLSNAERP
jgi:hypothetical protein